MMPSKELSQTQLINASESDPKASFARRVYQSLWDISAPEPLTLTSSFARIRLERKLTENATEDLPALRFSILSQDSLTSEPVEEYEITPEGAFPILIASLPSTDVLVTDLQKYFNLNHSYLETQFSMTFRVFHFINRVIDNPIKTQ